MEFLPGVINTLSHRRWRRSHSPAGTRTTTAPFSTNSPLSLAGITLSQRKPEKGKKPYESRKAVKLVFSPTVLSGTAWQTTSPSECAGDLSWVCGDGPNTPHVSTASPPRAEEKNTAGVRGQSSGVQRKHSANCVSDFQFPSSYI